MKTLKIPDKFNITENDVVEICKKSNISKSSVEKNNFTRKFKSNRRLCFL